MGTPAKSKASVRSSSKAKYTRDKVPSTDADCKILPKKFIDSKNSTQKPKEKVTETWQVSNKNFGLGRKLNGVNNGVAKGIKKPAAIANDIKLTTCTSIKNNIESVLKSFDRAMEKSTDSKSYWHDILMNGKNRKFAFEQREEHVTAEDLELGKEFPNLELPKSDGSVSSVNERTSNISQDSEMQENESKKEITVEFDNVFQNLRQNATGNEKQFLEQKRKELQLIYYGLANSKTPEKTQPKSVKEKVKPVLETKEIESDTVSVKEENEEDQHIPAAAKKKVTIKLPEFVVAKDDDSTTTLAYQEAENSTENIPVIREEVQVDDISSISLLEIRINGNGSSAANHNLKTIVQPSVSLETLKEETASEEEENMKMNFDIEGFENSDGASVCDYFGTFKHSNNYNDSDFDARSTISIHLDERYKGKKEKNVLDVGGGPNSKKEAPCKRGKVKFDIGSQNEEEIDEKVESNSIKNEPDIDTFEATEKYSSEQVTERNETKIDKGNESDNTEVTSNYDEKHLTEEETENSEATPKNSVHYFQLQKDEENEVFSKNSDKYCSDDEAEEIKIISKKTAHFACEDDEADGFDVHSEKSVNTENFEEKSQNGDDAYLSADEADKFETDTAYTVKSENSIEADECLSSENSNIHISEHAVDMKNPYMKWSVQEDDVQPADTPTFTDMMPLAATLNLLTFTVDENEEEKKKDKGDLQLKEELEKIIKSENHGSHAVTAGFSEMLLSALDVKPNYQEHEVYQSQQKASTEWGIYNERVEQKNTENTAPKENAMENVQQKATLTNIEEADFLSISSHPQLLATQNSSHDDIFAIVRENLSAKDLVATILEELKGKGAGMGFANNPVRANEMLGENNSAAPQINHRNSAEIETKSTQKAAPPTKSFLYCGIQNKSASEKFMRYPSQSSSQHKAVEQSLAAGMRQPNISAQDWMKEFLDRMSKTVELSLSEEQSRERLELHKRSPPKLYTMGKQQKDYNVEDAIEVFSKKSDTQLLLQQLEFNLEQIRVGLTELSKACDNDFEKKPRNNQKFLPVPGGIRKSFSFPNNTIRNIAMESDKNAWCISNSNTVNSYKKEEKKFPNNVKPSEMSNKKCVTWGKVENFKIESSIMSSKNKIISTNKSKAAKDGNAPKHLKAGKENNDVKRCRFETASLSKKIEVKKKEPKVKEQTNTLKERNKVIKVTKSFRREGTPDRRIDDLKMPRFAGCPCMFDAYKTIAAQIKNTTQELEKLIQSN